MKLLVIAVAAMLLAAACGSGGGERIVIAAGTTLVDSGLLDRLIEQYEADTPGVRISAVGEATAQAIELGRNGAADLVITHAPQDEQLFIDGGHSVRDALVLQSRFVLLGPADLIADLAGLSAADAFREIAARGLPFVSRADGSGTYAREIELWAWAGVGPSADQLIETGQGMGLTLQVADQRSAFVLSEAGSYLTASELISLKPVALDPGPELSNPYRAMVVAGGSERAASLFVDWLLSATGREAILDANDALFGEVVYAPVS